jgi:HD-like signal output (HDOD) protein
MRRILFVDDEPSILDGLMRMLYMLRREWEMVFAESGEQALRLLQESSFDVLVTDIRMPGMSGIELLTEVVKTQPEILRIVLSGTADHEITLKTADLAHQYLMKPCDPKVLRATIERALSLKFMLQDASLRRVISSLRTLPSLPSVYSDLMEALSSPDISSSTVGSIVARDIGMTSKLLQLANSSFFGTGRTVLDPAAAVGYLGYETIRSLALQVAVFSQFDGARIPEFSIEALQTHSARVAARARVIAQNARLSVGAVNDCVAGGFLHDLGKLALAANLPYQYARAVRTSVHNSLPIELAELQEFGATHSEVGAYLLWLWGIPDTVTEIVAFHHNPPLGADLTPVAVVYMANEMDLGRLRPEAENQCKHLARECGRSWEALTCGVQ